MNTPPEFIRLFEELDGLTLEGMRKEAEAREGPGSFAFFAVREPTVPHATALTARALLAVVVADPALVAAFKLRFGGRGWGKEPWDNISLKRAFAASAEAQSLLIIACGKSASEWDAVAFIAATPDSIATVEAEFFPQGK